ncbi:MAG: DUF456 domain-containing protein, partial [Clostridia bacterium]
PGSRRISYDPQSQIERYHGDATDSINSSYEVAGLTEQREQDLLDSRRNRTEATDATKYETSAEIAPPLRTPLVNDAHDPKPDEQATGTGLGMTAIGLSILSLFILPYLTAPVGIVLGYMAFRRNTRTLGLWSMIIGALSLIGALVVYPYLVAR